MNWAKELGIDLNVLATESFTHHTQIYLHKKLQTESDEYWQYRRNSERVEQLMEESEVPGQKRAMEKNKRRSDRRRRMADYVFTDAQIQIALGSFHAKDSM
jgi:hypothetical protein